MNKLSMLIVLKRVFEKIFHSILNTLKTHEAFDNVLNKCTDN